jgi:hypothetical protein
MQPNVNRLIFIAGTFGVLLLHAIARLRLRRQAALTRKYRYFKLRDDLIYLVASEQIHEEDFVFQQFYKVVNFLINHSKTLDLTSFLEALREASEKGLDPTEDKILKRLREELPKKNLATQKVVLAFFDTVIGTLLENSLLLRVALNYPSLFKLVTRVHGWFYALPSAGAYVFYRRYEKAGNQIELSAAA